MELWTTKLMGLWKKSQKARAMELTKETRMTKLTGLRKESQKAHGKEETMVFPMAFEKDLPMEYPMTRLKVCAMAEIMMVFPIAFEKDLPME
jgi:hypothetical protein